MNVIGVKEGKGVLPSMPAGRDDTARNDRTGGMKLEDVSVTSHNLARVPEKNKQKGSAAGAALFDLYKNPSYKRARALPRTPTGSGDENISWPSCSSSSSDEDDATEGALPPRETPLHEPTREHLQPEFTTPYEDAPSTQNAGLYNADFYIHVRQRSRRFSHESYDGALRTPLNTSSAGHDGETSGGNGVSDIGVTSSNPLYHNGDSTSAHVHEPEQPLPGPALPTQDSAYSLRGPDPTSPALQSLDAQRVSPGVQAGLVRAARHATVRWIFDVACGRRRSNYYAPLVFLVPCSVCVCIFAWPMLLPADLVQAAYSAAAQAGAGCQRSMAEQVAPVVAAAYTRSMQECQSRNDCPLPRYLVADVCGLTTACGGAQDALDALGVGPRRRQRRSRSLLQFDVARDALSQSGLVPGLDDDATSHQLAQATSSCLGCELILREVVATAQDRTNSTSEAWVAAMTRVHGREWCARRAAAMLPPYNPWATYRGIMRWNDVGNTPADPVVLHPDSAHHLPRIGGAEHLLARDTDTSATWPPTAGDSYDPSGIRWFGTGTGDPRVNEALMARLMRSTANTGCPKNRPGRYTIPGISTPAPPPEATALSTVVTTAVNHGGYPNAPPWARHCVVAPEQRVYGWVGVVSRISSENLGVGSWWSIAIPACFIFPVMVINGVGMIRFVESPFVLGGLVFWTAVGVDNALAVLQLRKCMDEVFLALNLLHLSIVAAAMLAATGILGSRAAEQDTAWQRQCQGWRRFSRETVAGHSVAAPFSMPRANAVVRGDAKLLASRKFQKLMPHLVVARLQFLGNLLIQKGGRRGGWKSWVWRSTLGSLMRCGVMLCRLLVFCDSFRGASSKRQGRVRGAAETAAAEENVGKAIAFGGLLESAVAVERQKPGGARRLEQQILLWFQSRSVGGITKRSAKVTVAAAAEILTAEESSPPLSTLPPLSVAAGRRKREGRLSPSGSDVAMSTKHGIPLGPRSDAAKWTDRCLPNKTEVRPVLRPVPELMVAWREAVQCILDANSAARVIEISKDGQPSWQTARTPVLRVQLSQRMLMGVTGSLFVTLVSTILATQQIRRILEVLRWSFDARWCTWLAWGVREAMTNNLDGIATVSLHLIPAIVVVVVLVQLYHLSDRYRSQIRALRRGEAPFTKFQLVNFANPATASEWVGYQLVLTGFTYFCTLFLLTGVTLLLTWPIVYYIIGRHRVVEEVSSWVWTLFLSWALCLLFSSGYRTVHLILFTEPRLRVIRYPHYFQLSDFLMLYLTMQRSFVVVVVRLAYSVAGQVLCIMRSDMTFFPEALGAFADPPHASYVAMVLSDWLHTCPIARSFCDVLVEIAEGARGGRREFARNVARQYGATLPTVYTMLGWDDIPPEDDQKPRSTPPPRRGLSRYQSSPVGMVEISKEDAAEVQRVVQAQQRRQRAKTRWFLALTLHFNPALIKMRRPRGTPLRALHLVTPSCLPHAAARGWLRRRGGAMGLMGNVSDTFVVVAPGVLYIFDDDLATDPRVHVLSRRMTARRLYMSPRDQLVGGWHFLQDYYLPGPEEVELVDAEEGGLAGVELDTEGTTLSSVRCEHGWREWRIPHGDVEDEEDGVSLESTSTGRSVDRKKKPDVREGAATHKMKSNGRGVSFPHPSFRDGASRGSNSLSHKMSPARGSRWKLRAKHFFAIFVPGGPMEVLAATTADDAMRWVELLRKECSAMP